MVDNFSAPHEHSAADIAADGGCPICARAAYADLERCLAAAEQALERVQFERQRDVLSRHTALDEMVQMRAKLAALEADAQRYRWLADKVIASDYGDNDSQPHQKGYLIRHCKGPAVIYGDSLDAAIDALL